MSYTIPDNSPWKAAAARVGAELRTALEARRVGWRQLNAAVGKDMHSMLDRYKSGRNLPRLAQAALLAEALAWPRILELVREARTFYCPIDGRQFVCDTGHRQKFCSSRCRDVDGKNRARLNALASREAAAYANEDPERVLVARLKQELEEARQQRRPAHVREIRSAIKQWESTSSQSRHRRTRNQLNEHLAAVEAMCRSCEPDGICRTADCALRAVSPLRFAPMVDVGLAEAKDPRGGWSDPEIRARRSAAQSERLRELYRREPERIAAHRQRMQTRWEHMTPEERVEWGRKVSARRKGRASFRACGCPNRAHYADCPTREATA